MPGASKSEELRGKVRRWVVEAGWAIQDGQSPDALWVFRGEFKGPPIMIFYLMPKPWVLVLRSDYSLSPQAQAAWESLAQEERATFFGELRFRLLSAGPEFELDPETLKVSVIEKIFQDGLSEDTFWQRVKTVRRVSLLAAWTILLRLGIKAEADAYTIN